MNRATSSKRKQMFVLMSGTGSIVEKRRIKIEDILCPLDEDIACTERIDKYDHWLMNQVYNGYSLSGRSC